jgi:hypothetical protein
LLVDFPCVFLFLQFFSSLKIIRISYGGEHNSWAQVHSWSLGIRPYLQNSIHIGRTDTTFWMEIGVLPARQITHLLKHTCDVRFADVLGMMWASLQKARRANSLF